MQNDTIAAIATPPGEGGISVIRLSGPEAEQILRKVFRRAGKPGEWESHRMYYGWVMDGEEKLDEGMGVMMRAPRSYTREDVAEIQIHGGAWGPRKAVEICLRNGARLAEAGEFTRRAFLNGRIDLSRAEAVMSVIAARGEQEHRAAEREMNGGVTAFVRGAADELYAIQAGVAACVDYPEEISDEEGAAEMIPRLEKLIESLKAGVSERSARLIRDGLRVALIGRPNVGKSSLLNALLGEERAIVTAIPGTTRDLVEGEMMIEGTRVHLTDTAGVREAEDPVERMGVERSRRAMADADVTLMVLDDSEEMTDEDRKLMDSLREPAALVVNKTDLGRKLVLPESNAFEVIEVSAKRPESVRAIKEYLAGLARVTDRTVMTQPRQLDALGRAISHLEDALETARNLTPDMTATDLQAAQAALGEITGDQVDEKLLDEVFSRFCVGK